MKDIVTLRINELYKMPLAFGFLVFLTKDSVYIVSTEDLWDSKPKSSITFLRLSGLKFKVANNSLNLFISISLIAKEAPDENHKKAITEAVACINASLDSRTFNLIKFVKAVQEVAHWGRIPRVYGNIVKRLDQDKSHSTEDLECIWKYFKVIIKEKNTASGGLSDKQKDALRKILSSKKGFGMALTTKFLRLKDPQRFVILDSVFRGNLCFDGYDIRPTSEDYSQFLEKLNTSRFDYNNISEIQPLSPGDFEYAIFQIVNRSQKLILSYSLETIEK